MSTDIIEEEEGEIEFEIKSGKVSAGGIDFNLDRDGLTDREFARTEILLEANRYILGRGFQPGKVFTRRHINQAVCIARRRKLVPGEMLEMAGFNAREKW